jgi:glycosyltransferase involved in cell wall biosynthesis
VSVVIPALNEADCIGWVLERVPEWVSEVVLVDGRSTDSTEVVARGLMTDLVVVHQPVLGKGAALRAGFAAASGEVIVMLDADGSTNPAELGRFVQALHGGAGFVKGSRHLPEGGSVDWTLLRRTGNRALVRLTNLIHGCRFTDLCYGYCAFWRRDLPALQLTADGFEVETALVLGAVKAGLKIREVPSVELPRLAGVSNLNAFRDGRRVLRTIFEQRPGRRAGAERVLRRVELVPVELASPGTPGWVPAGKDRRNGSGDRRKLNRAASGYTGPERRRSQRRQTPRHTVTVYRAVERPAGLELAPQPAEPLTEPARSAELA